MYIAQIKHSCGDTRSESNLFISSKGASSLQVTSNTLQRTPYSVSWLSRNPCTVGFCRLMVLFIRRRRLIRIHRCKVFCTLYLTVGEGGKASNPLKWYSMIHIEHI